MMPILDDFIKGLKAIAHPTSGTGTSMDIKSAMLYYYKFALIPFLLSIIVNFIAVGSNQIGVTPAQLINGLGFSGLFGYLSSFMINQYGLIYFQFWELITVINFIHLLIGVPLSILFSAAIYQALGKYVFKKFKSGYENTLTAVMYNELPVIAVTWLGSISILGPLSGVVAIVYSIYVLVVSLSLQQKVSKKFTLLIWFIPSFVGAIILAIAYPSAFATLLKGP